MHVSYNVMMFQSSIENILEIAVLFQYALSSLF
jgi:hypothetical protein